LARTVPTSIVLSEFGWIVQKRPDPTAAYNPVSAVTYGSLAWRDGIASLVETHLESRFSQGDYCSGHCWRAITDFHLAGKWFLRRIDQPIGTVGYQTETCESFSGANGDGVSVRINPNYVEPLPKGYS
jgi:hypothetical protein